MTNVTVSEIKRLNLLRIMAERGLKNVDLSRILNVSAPHITNILKKEGKTKRGIGQETIDKLCVALGINEIEFYKWDIIDGPKDSVTIKKPAPHILQLMLDVQYVLESDFEIIAMALYQNINAFKHSIESSRKLMERVSEIEREVTELKKAAPLQLMSGLDFSHTEHPNGLKIVSGGR